MSDLAFMPEASAEEREEYLKSQAVETLTEEHYRPLTNEELAAVQSNYIQNVDKIEKLEDEIKAFKKDKKDQIDVLLSENAQLKVCSLTKQAEVVEKLYAIDDQKGGVMNYFNVQGTFIRSRRLLPEERQLRVDRHGSID